MYLQSIGNRPRVSAKQELYLLYIEDVQSLNMNNVHSGFATLATRLASLDSRRAPRDDSHELNDSCHGSRAAMRTPRVTRNGSHLAGGKATKGA